MVSTDDYQRAVAALFARHPTRMVPDLDRITTLSELLGRPDQSYPAIQITGTNGKTTVTQMVACLLAALGVKAGSYTSPHLQDVRERIRIAGEPIERDELVSGLDYLDPFLAEVDARYPDLVTFFEVLTALAFVHFADSPVDVGVFEVGLGGRWDATNLVRGDVAVLTTVSLDHDILGLTTEAIAGEKVGIIKPGAAVISAAQDPDVTAVIAGAAERAEAQLLIEGSDFSVESRELAVGGQLLSIRGVTGTVEDVYLPLHGEHQSRNAACALAAVEGFLGFAGVLNSEVIREGFAAARSPGRLEVVRRQDASTVILDGAHNPAGARVLAAALADEFAFRNRIVVLGVLSDKAVDGIVEELLPVASHVIVTEPPTSRAAPAERLEKVLRASGMTVEAAVDIGAALELATGLAGEEDAVVVTGSLYTVGAARDALGLSVF